MQGTEARDFINTYIEKKGPKLMEVAEGLRRLLKALEKIGVAREVK